MNIFGESLQCTYTSKIVSEYDQEIPQSQTADKLREEEPQNNRETQGRQTKRLVRDLSNVYFQLKDECFNIYA